MCSAAWCGMSEPREAWGSWVSTRGHGTAGSQLLALSTSKTKTSAQQEREERSQHKEKWRIFQEEDPDPMAEVWSLSSDGARGKPAQHTGLQGVGVAGK